MDRRPINAADVMAMQDLVTSTTTTTLRQPRLSIPCSFDIQQAALARLLQTSLSSNDQALPGTWAGQRRTSTASEPHGYGATLNEWPFPVGIESTTALDADMTWAVDERQASPFGPNTASSATDSYVYPALSSNDSLPPWASQPGTSAPGTAAIFPGAPASASGTPITSPGSQFSGCDEMFETFRSALDESGVQQFDLQFPTLGNLETGAECSSQTPRSSIDTGRRLSHGQVRTSGSFKRQPATELTKPQATHPRPTEKKPAKRGHNVVEKRYRTNLNDKLERLRDRIPSLCTNGPVGAVAGGSDEGRKSNHNRPNKANILEKAVEYIQQLENGLKQTSDENARLRVRVRALEKIVLGGDEARSHLGALLDASM